MENISKREKRQEKVIDSVWRVQAKTERKGGEKIERMMEREIERERGGGGGQWWSEGLSEPPIIGKLKAVTHLGTSIRLSLVRAVDITFDMNEPLN